MAGRIEWKAALITGGGSGIGRATAERFAREGARVCVVDRSLEGAAETVQHIESAGGQAFAEWVDVTDEADVERAVRHCLETYGGLDALVAAAGIARAPGQSGPLPLWEQLLEAFNSVLDVNLHGVLISNRTVVRAMLASGRPGVIDTPMTAGLQQNEELQRRALRGIPLRRVGRPEEIASTAPFPASDDASYFTGQMLHPAGGIYTD